MCVDGGGGGGRTAVWVMWDSEMIPSHWSVCSGDALTVDEQKWMNE